MRTKISSISAPKFGEIGSWDQANRTHFRVYFNPPAICFIFLAYGVDNKVDQKIVKLTKFYGEKTVRPPGKWSNVTLIHPTSYKPQFFIDEGFQ